MRPVAPPESFQTDSTSASGLATTSIAKDPLPISAASSGSSGEDAGRADRTLSAAEEVNVGLAQRSGREADAGPGDGADLHPRDQPGPVVASGQQGHDRRLGRFAPQIVEHHVDVRRLGRQFVVRRARGRPPGRWCRRRRGPPWRRAWSAPRPAATTAPAPRCLAIWIGELPGRAGGTEYQHRLPAPQADPLLQRHPRRHARIHRGRQQDRVGTGGKRDAAANVDDGALGHGAVGGVREDEVHQRSIGPAADTVDARDEGELVGRGVVGSVRL